MIAKYHPLSTTPRGYRRVARVFIVFLVCEPPPGTVVNITFFWLTTPALAGRDDSGENRYRN